MADIQIKRVYEAADRDDGRRVLVDRVWPRGMTRERVKADLWLKDIAPSTALRKWFSHDRTKWEGFKARYFRELDAKSGVVARLREETPKRRLTLLFTARDPACNHALALKEYLLSRAAAKARQTPAAAAGRGWQKRPSRGATGKRR